MPLSTIALELKCLEMSGMPYGAQTSRSVPKCLEILLRRQNRNKKKLMTNFLSNHSQSPLRHLIDQTYRVVSLNIPPWALWVTKCLEMSRNHGFSLFETFRDSAHPYYAGVASRVTNRVRAWPGVTPRVGATRWDARECLQMSRNVPKSSLGSKICILRHFGTLFGLACAL